MIRHLAVSLLLCLPAGGANAACTGQDILPTLDADQRAGITSAVDSLAYGRGNHWRASSTFSAPITLTTRATTR
jgi:hypothetical protein